MLVNKKNILVPLPHLLRPPSWKDGRKNQFLPNISNYTNFRAKCHDIKNYLSKFLNKSCSMHFYCMFRCICATGHFVSTLGLSHQGRRVFDVRIYSPDINWGNIS
ncbi:unnamed protein product [Meganyctiphanes norvegica]|uniref:Uncharacterized protein n=1 Tax=Meganyctiphanes norvegica TaxID=48144 RepID=A0AAV2QAT9_MEGNR